MSDRQDALGVHTDADMDRQYNAGQEFERMCAVDYFQRTSKSLAESARLSAKGNDYIAAMRMQIAAEWTMTAAKALQAGDHHGT